MPIFFALQSNEQELEVTVGGCKAATIDVVHSVAITYYTDNVATYLGESMCTTVSSTVLGGDV